MRSTYHGRRIWSSWLWACGLLVAVAGTSAAQPTVLPFDQQPQPTFRADVTLITTDVIVRDGNGQFIADLTKDEFTVFEDDVPQEIVSVVLINGGRAFNLQLPPAPAQQEGIILPTARPRQDAAGRIFMLFVDDLHFEADETPRIRHLFKQISETLIHEGDLFSIVSTGPSSLAINLTYDRNLLESAISRIMGSGLTPTDVITGAQGSQGPPEVFYRVNVAFSTARQIVDSLAGVENRRKAVIYVSNGYDLNPFEKSRFEQSSSFAGQFRLDDDIDVPVNPFMRQTNYAFADMDLSLQLNRLTNAANRANASFYTIDPRGLVAGVDLGEMRGGLDPEQWFEHVRKTQDSLRTLAEATGGIAVVNQNDFGTALKRIDADTSDYYVLGYYSNNPDPQDTTRRLRVEVSRDDLSVWSRDAYSLPDPTPDPVETETR